MKQIIVELKPTGIAIPRKKTLVLPPTGLEEIGRRRLGAAPWIYNNTRTIHYQSYRTRGSDADDVLVYFNLHNSVVSDEISGMTYAFLWTNPPGAGDNIYYTTVVSSLETTTDGVSLTYDWSVTGSPDGIGDTSGSKTYGPGDLNDDPQFYTAAPNAIAQLSVIGLSFPGSYSWSEDIEPQWINYTRTLTFHASKTRREHKGAWVDPQPGLSVYGNNVQGSETFFGGSGFPDEPIANADVTPLVWTAYIDAYATVLMDLLEAEPHIRNVSQSDVSVSFG